MEIQQTIASSSSIGMDSNKSTIPGNVNTQAPYCPSVSERRDTIQKTPQQTLLTYTFLAIHGADKEAQHLSDPEKNNIAKGLCFGLSEMEVHSPGDFKRMIELQNELVDTNQFYKGENNDQSKYTATQQSENLQALSASVPTFEGKVENLKKLSCLQEKFPEVDDAKKKEFTELYRKALAMSDTAAQSMNCNKYNQAFVNDAGSMFGVLDNLNKDDYAKVGTPNHELAIHVDADKFVLYDPNKVPSEDNAKHIAFEKSQDGVGKMFDLLHSRYSGGCANGYDNSKKELPIVISSTSDQINKGNNNLVKITSGSLESHYNMASDKYKKIIAKSTCEKIVSELNNSKLLEKLKKKEVIINQDGLRNFINDTLNNPFPTMPKQHADYKDIVDIFKTGIRSALGAPENSTHFNKMDLSNMKASAMSYIHELTEEADRKAKEAKLKSGDEIGDSTSNSEEDIGDLFG